MDPPSSSSSSSIIKHYFYYGHRAAARSPLRPSVRSPPLRRNPPTSKPSPLPSSPSLHSFLHSTSPLPSTTSLHSARRLSPIARFIVSALTKHGKWGPEVVAELGKLRHVPPNLVTEVLRLRPGLSDKLLVPFFIWAGKQRNFRHEYAGFNAYAHLVSRKNPGLIDGLPDLMRCHGKVLSEKQVDVIVRVHAEAGRGLRALEGFKRMRKEFGIKPRVFLYNRVFEVLVRGGHVCEALSLYEKEFKEDGLREEAITFMILCKGLSRVKRVDKVLELIEKMRVRVCKPDLFAYTALLKLMADRGYMDGCLKVWEEMKKDGVKVDPMGYKTMILGLCKVGNVNKAYEMFDEMKEEKVLVDRSIFGALIEGFVSQRRVGEALGVLKEMVGLGFRADLGIYDSLISGLCEVELKVDKALKLFEIVIKEGIKPGFKTTTPLLMYFADLGQVKECVDLVYRMKELGLPVINHLTDFFNSFLEMNEKEYKSYMVFLEMKEKGYTSVEIYNIIIEGLYKGNNNYRHISIELFNELLESENLCPNSDTYSLIIPCFVELDNVKEACLYYNKMMENSYIPTSNAYSSLVNGLCKIGEINSAITLVKYCLGTLTSGPIEFKYVLTILNVCKMKKPEKVVEVLDEMVIELGYSLEDIMNEDIMYCCIIYGFCKYASSAEARKVFYVLRDRGDLKEARVIVFEDILNEHLKKVTAQLVVSGLKFFGLESELKWTSKLDEL